ncbi:MAG: hypothetical protein ACI9G1_003728, partial [Pirellulaceae bacterium]
GMAADRHRRGYELGHGLVLDGCRFRLLCREVVAVT